MKATDGSTYFGHDDILTVFDILILSFDDGLQEFDVEHFAAMQFNQVNEMLHVLLGDRLAELNIIHKDVTACLHFLFLEEHRGV